LLVGKTKGTVFAAGLYNVILSKGINRRMSQSIRMVEMFKNGLKTRNGLHMEPRWIQSRLLDRKAIRTKILVIL